MYRFLEGNPAVQLPEYKKSNTADTARAVAPVTASANRGVATAASPLAGTSGCFLGEVSVFCVWKPLNIFKKEKDVNHVGTRL